MLAGCIGTLMSRDQPEGYTFLPNLLRLAQMGFRPLRSASGRRHIQNTVTRKLATSQLRW
jgi:hypothetical protein